MTGSQAWVTILCRFADETDITLHPVSHYEKLIPVLGHYWNEVSYGNIPDLRGSIIVGLYSLPEPHSYYVGDAGSMMEDCIAAADADVFFPDFQGISMIFAGDISRDGSIAGLGGSFFWSLDGQRKSYGFTASVGGEPNVIAHEMGHAFGLPHSSGPYDETYDSQWDVMSWGRNVCGSFGLEDHCLDVHTIAYHKDLLGWIPPARKYVATPNTTHTIFLERLAQPSAEGYLMAQIPIGESTTDFYTVEARLFAGYDNVLPGEAVIVHKVDTAANDRPG